MSVWAIGDVQGCYAALRCLLKEIRFNDQCDRLWFAGDLVNRGPKSLKTLRFIYKLRDNCDVVLGNHDLHLLAVAHGVRPITRKDTFGDVLESKHRDKLLNWLQCQSLMHVDESLRFAMVHAGIPPVWTLQQAHGYAQEIEGVLKSRRALEFFTAMYGDTPSCWGENQNDDERWRVITNYLTRMRFCTMGGMLDLQDKSSIRSDRPGFNAWFDYFDCHQEGVQLVFGHWAALQGNTGVEGVHALDTGCVWGGQLTAMNLETGERVACSCKS